MALYMPQGYGVGIPMDSYLRAERFRHDSLGYVRFVLDRLQPDWFYFWDGWDLATSQPQSLADNAVYSTIPHWWETEDVLGRLEAGGLQLDRRSWLLMCEPNRQEYGGLTPEEAVVFTHKTYAAFQRRFPEVCSYALWGPGANINGENFAWLQAFWRYMRHGALRPRLAVHVWGRPPDIRAHWNIFTAWWRTVDRSPFIVTEAGPGGDATPDEAADWLKEMAPVMQRQPEMLSFCQTAAEHEWNGQHWNGLLNRRGELTPLGRVWTRLRDRDARRATKTQGVKGK